MTCPVCRRDDLAYLNCNRPDCTDGLHVPIYRERETVSPYQGPHHKPYSEDMLAFREELARAQRAARTLLLAVTLSALAMSVFLLWVF